MRKRKSTGVILEWQTTAVPYFEAHPELQGKVYTRAAWIRSFQTWFGLTRHVADFWVDRATDFGVFSPVGREPNSWNRTEDKNSPMLKLVDHNRWRPPPQPSEAFLTACSQQPATLSATHAMRFLESLSSKRVISAEDDDDHSGL